jgi:GABA(A) receptor-associated protein
MLAYFRQAAPGPSHRHRSAMPFEQRREEAERIRGDARYVGRIPVLVERAERASPDLPDLGSNSKFLVPDTLTVGQLVYVIRQRLTLPPEIALFIYALDEAGKMTSLPSSALLREVDARYADADRFLYIIYSGEVSFG